VRRLLVDSHIIYIYIQSPSPLSTRYIQLGTIMGGNISTLGQTQGGRVAGVVGFT
jgi:hypothetical protein